MLNRYFLTKGQFGNLLSAKEKHILEPNGGCAPAPTEVNTNNPCELNGNRIRSILSRCFL